MKKLLIIFSVILGFWGCDKEGEVVELNTELVGEWNWIGTSGGFAYHIHTSPETTGKSIQVIFSDNFECIIIENENVTFSGSYDLSLKESIHSHELKTNISLQENFANSNIVLNGIIVAMKNDTLSISDNYYDGVGSSFVKM